MTLFTSLGPSADCRGLTQVPTYRERTGHARGAAFSVSQRGFSLGWGLQGKVARTPHQSKGSGGTVCLVHEPGAGIVAVRRLGEVFLKSPFRAIAATTILIDHDIAMVDKEGRDFLARCGALRVVARDFRATRLPFPVRRAFENDGERPGNGLPGG